jgi:hypothetical protein
MSERGVCVLRCGEREGPYNFAEAERCSLMLPGRAGRAVPEGAGGPRTGSQAAVLPDLIHKSEDEDVAKQINVKVHCNFYGNRLSDRHSTGGVPRYVRS